MKLLPIFVLFLNSSYNHANKNAPNQADNISIFQLCLLLKMNLSVDLEGRYVGYKTAKLIDGTYLRHKNLQIDFVLTTDIFSYDPIES